MTATRFFLFFLSGGQRWRTYMNRDREVHIDWTAINAPTSFPLWARQRKQLKVSPQSKHVQSPGKFNLPD